MTFQNRRSKQSFHIILNGVPFCVSPNTTLPRYSASEAMSPRPGKKCLCWRAFLGFTDLAQEGDPGMAAGEVEAASCS